RRFADADQRQKNSAAKAELGSWQGYWRCDLLLARGAIAAACDQAGRAREIAKQENWLSDTALHTLALGRTYLNLALSHAALHFLAASEHDDAHRALAQLREAVDGFHASGHVKFVPQGLLALAAFHRSVGDWDGAARDLDEVEEIAELGPMRLYLCDMALERTRLAFA